MAITVLLTKLTKPSTKVLSTKPDTVAKALAMVAVKLTRPSMTFWSKRAIRLFRPSSPLTKTFW